MPTYRTRTIICLPNRRRRTIDVLCGTAAECSALVRELWSVGVKAWVE